MPDNKISPYTTNQTFINECFMEESDKNPEPENEHINEHIIKYGSSFNEKGIRKIQKTINRYAYSTNDSLLKRITCVAYKVFNAIKEAVGWPLGKVFGEKYRYRLRSDWNTVIKDMVEGKPLQYLKSAEQEAKNLLEELLRKENEIRDNLDK